MNERFKNIIQARELAHSKLDSNSRLIFKCKAFGKYKFVDLYCRGIWVDLLTNSVERENYNHCGDFCGYEKL